MFRVMEKTVENAKVQLGPRLNLGELYCPCNEKNCTMVLYHSKVIAAYNKLVGTVGEKVEIKESHFCQHYNESIDGDPRSRNCMGTSITLKCPENRIDLSDFASHCKRLFTKVEVDFNGHTVKCEFEAFSNDHYTKVKKLVVKLATDNILLINDDIEILLLKERQNFSRVLIKSTKENFIGQKDRALEGAFLLNRRSDS